MKALTYDQWKSAGFFVRKGDTATGRNTKGEATFTREQVEDKWDADEGLTFDELYGD